MYVYYITKVGKDKEVCAWMVSLKKSTTTCTKCVVFFVLFFHGTNNNHYSFHIVLLKKVSHNDINRRYIHH